MWPSGGKKLRLLSDDVNNFINDFFNIYYTDLVILTFRMLSR